MSKKEIKAKKKNGVGKFVLGALVGAGLGVLLAPKSGSETREELKEKDAVMANQCTCSNCNCRSANNMVNLSKLYKEKLSNA